LADSGTVRELRRRLADDFKGVKMSDTEERINVQAIDHADVTGYGAVTSHVSHCGVVAGPTLVAVELLRLGTQLVSVESEGILRLFGRVS
jgi:hypothetical protein